MRKLLVILAFTVLYTSPNKNDFNKLFINVAENGSPCIVSIVSEKIEKISSDEKLRKTIGKKGKNKYMKYFNSTLVADFIINKTFNINSKSKYLWHKP